jgi:hypothetical protein
MFFIFYRESVLPIVFLDLSYSLVETMATTYKVYQGIEECLALYKKKPKQSLSTAAFYISILGVALLKLYNTLNFRSYFNFSSDGSLKSNCERVSSLSDKLEDRVNDDRLRSDCLYHQAQLVNPKYEFEIVEEQVINEASRKSELIKRISPLNFEVSKFKKKCNKFSLEFHPDKTKSTNAEKISQRILTACKEIKSGLKQL